MENKSIIERVKNEYSNSRFDVKKLTVMVIEAQKVTKGEMLAKLDQRDLLTQLKSARAQFKNANIEYQRTLRLIKQDAISSCKLEERKSKRDVNWVQK